ncbi:MAG: thiolase [Alphaproteobacteria bacterium]|nr:thiolase [Alphaproteobacteria bacterium]
MSRMRDVAIVGVAESDEIGIVPHKSALQHHAEAAHNALADAGLCKSDVDAVFTARISTLATAEYMGIEPRYSDSTWMGGGSFEAHVAHATAAIRAGFCEVALITHGQTGRSARVPSPAHVNNSPETNQPHLQYEEPYGFIGAPVNYAIACTRYMHRFGEARTRQALAEIAVATRAWACLNPRALMRQPMTFDEYHNSRWIAWPFHLLDCCLLTDAGGAVVVTTAERARDLPKPPVWVFGAAESHDHAMISQMPDLTSTTGRRTGPQAMAMAGVRHADLDLAMLYDAFTYTTLVTLEDLGFCAKGEGPDFVAGQRTAPGGAFAVNTNGGGLSYTHTGMYGIFLLIEAVRQLRGECGARQVPHCRLALVNGIGGILSSTATLVLGVA